MKLICKICARSHREFIRPDQISIHFNDMIYDEWFVYNLQKKLNIIVKSDLVFKFMDGFLS